MKRWIVGAGLCAMLAVMAAQGAEGPAANAQPDRSNLAINKPVTVSGESQEDNIPTKAVDGVSGNESGWHCGESPAWLAVDLQKVYSIDRLKVFLYQDGVRFYQYSVELSADEKTWAKVVDMSGNTKASTPDGDEHHFAAAKGRYVRVNLLKNSANPGVHLNEIMVFEAPAAAAALELQSRAYIDFTGEGGTLAFADSAGKKWDLSKTLVIQNWRTGKSKIVVGQGKDGLTREQLVRVLFADPTGQEPGVLYRARIGDDGQLTPGGKLEAINPPFDLSSKARAEREKLYTIAGRAKLAGQGTPLKKGMVVSFFGDSITWQNVYINKIDEALHNSEVTRDLGIKLANHGINGGGVLSVRDGSPSAAYVSEANTDGKQAPFAEVIAADKADVAVVFIGVNDIWWRNTKPEDFETLKDIVASAKANKTIPVLATLSVWGDNPDPKGNPHNPKCDEFAQITRKVAADTGAKLVDLRTAFVAYLQNHNGELNADGTLKFADSGLLTYDGVHPSEQGNELLADCMAQGIYEALKK